MDRRVFTTILVCLAILIAWQSLGPRIFPHWFPEVPDADEVMEEVLPEAPDPEPEPVDPLPEVAEDVPTPRPEQIHVLENEKVRAELTTMGAALRSWILKEERFTRTLDGEEQQVDLVFADPRDPLPLATTFEELEWPTDASYEVVEKTDDTVAFRAAAGGVTVDKVFHLPAGQYHIALSIRLSDAGAGPVEVTPRVHMTRTVHEDLRARRGLLNFAIPDLIRPACVVTGDIVRHAHTSEHPSIDLPGEASWAGIDERYFLMSLFEGVPDFEPGEPSRHGASCTLVAPEEHRYDAQLVLEPTRLATDDAKSFRMTAFLGPKFKSELDRYGNDLSEAVDFGILTVLALLLLWVMVFFEGLVSNWGLAIILLTFTVKLVLYPLTDWSMRSMERMRAIQPKMNALKEKLGKDKEKFQIEMMKLYREEKVNPFGGCLPLLLQLPIWIALYRTILSTAELYNAVFIPGWIMDLSSPEPGVIKFLPLAMGVSMYLMQKMTPQPATVDEMQARMQRFMLYFMPPFFTLIMYGLPSGLTLYIFTNNVLSIAQQLWIRKRLEAAREAEASGKKK